MPTIIEPEDFQSLSLSRYERLLSRDLIKLSKSTSYVDFYVFDEYAPLKKTAFILFVDHDDDEWSTVLETINSSATKHAKGICEIIEEDKFFIIEIRKAEGNLSKKEIKKRLNEELFYDDEDITVILSGEEFTVSSSKVDKSVGDEGSEFESEEEEKLVESFKEEWKLCKNLKKSLDAHLSSAEASLRSDPSGYSFQNAAMGLFEAYEDLEDALGDMIELGRKWKTQFGSIKYYRSAPKKRQAKLSKLFNKRLKSGKALLLEVLKEQEKIDSTYAIPKEVVKFKIKLSDLQSKVRKKVAEATRDQKKLTAVRADLENWLKNDIVSLTSEASSFGSKINDPKRHYFTVVSNDLRKLRQEIENQKRRLAYLLEVIQIGGDHNYGKTYYKILKAYDAFVREKTKNEMSPQTIKAYERVENFIEKWEKKSSRTDSLKGRKDSNRKKAFQRMRERMADFKERYYDPYLFKLQKIREKEHIKTMDDIMRDTSMYQRFEKHCKEKEFNAENLYFWEEMVKLLKDGFKEPRDSEEEAERLEKGLLEYKRLSGVYFDTANITGREKKDFVNLSKDIGKLEKDGIRESYGSDGEFVESKLLQDAISNLESMHNNIKSLMELDIFVRFKANEL